MMDCGQFRVPDSVRHRCGHGYCEPCFNQLLDPKSCDFRQEHRVVDHRGSSVSHRFGSIERQFSNPTAIISNKNVLYIADIGNYCVKKLIAQEQELSYLDHFGGKGPNDGQFKFPITDLTASPVGNIYVLYGLFAEYGIVELDSDGKFMRYVGETTDSVNPSGLDFHVDKLYVADVKSIKIFAFQPQPVLQAVIETRTRNWSLENLNQLLVWDADNIIVTDNEKGVHSFGRQNCLRIHCWHYNGEVIIAETDEIHRQNLKPSGLCKYPNGFLLVAYGRFVKIFKRENSRFSVPFDTLELPPDSDIERIDGVAVTSDCRKVVVCGSHGIHAFNDTVWGTGRDKPMQCTWDD